MKLKLLAENGMILLCDDCDNPLPGQRRVVLNQDLNSKSVTVEFVIDGIEVQIGNRIRDCDE